MGSEVQEHNHYFGPFFLVIASHSLNTAYYEILPVIGKLGF